MYEAFVVHVHAMRFTFLNMINFFFNFLCFAKHLRDICNLHVGHMS